MGGGVGGGGFPRVFDSLPIPYDTGNRQQRGASPELSRPERPKRRFNVEWPGPPGFPSLRDPSESMRRAPRTAPHLLCMSYDR